MTLGNLTCTEGGRGDRTGDRGAAGQREPGWPTRRRIDFNVMAASHAGGSKAWLTADEWREFLPFIAEECPQAVPAIEAILDSADEHTLFMGPGLLAGGTIEKGKTPRHFAYMLSAFESCGESRREARCADRSVGAGGKARPPARAGGPRAPGAGCRDGCVRQPRHRAARRRHPDRAGADGVDRPRRSSPRAVSNAGAMGIIETSSGELDVIRDEIRKMRDLTDKPFGVNIAQAFVRDPSIVDFVVDQGVTFVTTSAGSPTKYTAPLKDAGLTVFHVVPDLARRAEGGRRRRRRAHRRGRRGRRVQEPAAGRRRWCCSRSSCRRSTCPSSPPAASSTGRRWRPPSRSAPRGCSSAPGWCRAAESPDPRQLEAGDRRRRRDRHGLPQPAREPGAARPAHRAHERARVRHASTQRDGAVRQRPWTSTSAATWRRRIALCGQVAGRIDEIKPVAEIIDECARDCLATIATLAAHYPVRHGA